VTHRLKIFVTGLAVAAGLGSLGGAHAAPPAPPEMTVRLAGASSIGERLTRDAVAVWARKSGFPSLRTDTDIDPSKYEIVGQAAESARQLRVGVTSKGSSAGFEPLLRGQADLWMASQQVQQSDIDAMNAKGLKGLPSLAQMQTPGNENVIGLDALAIVSSPKNPVKRLTLGQIKDLFQGKITNWSAVGGANLPVKLYAMDPGAGYADVFCGQVIGIADVPACIASLARLAAPVFDAADDLTDQVAADPAGLSFVAFQDKRDARAMQIGTACGTALEPSSFLVQSNEYPLARRLYLYANPVKPLAPAARSYLDFVLSPEGQNAITMTGFATLTPSLSPEDYSSARLDMAAEAQDGGRTRVRAGDSRAFQEAVGGGDRLSITFRFQSGTSELDSRSIADLARLAAVIGSPANSGKQVVLIGFSSAIGDYARNRALSADRAAGIRELLTTKYGVKDVVSVGVGPAAAVACNLDSSAALNQRVEVWLRKRS
jgi:phosphate transport system substrate-binding protein